MKREIERERVKAKERERERERETVLVCIKCGDGAVYEILEEAETAAVYEPRQGRRRGRREIL